MLWVRGERGAELSWSWCIPMGLCVTRHSRHPRVSAAHGDSPRGTGLGCGVKGGKPSACTALGGGLAGCGGRGWQRKLRKVFPTLC